MKQKPAKKSTNRLRIFATIVGALVLAFLLFWFQDIWLWKTFTGKEGFSLKYPPGWVIENYEDNTNLPHEKWFFVSPIPWEKWGELREKYGQDTTSHIPGLVRISIEKPSTTNKIGNPPYFGKLINHGLSQQSRLEVAPYVSRDNGSAFSYNSLDALSGEYYFSLENSTEYPHGKKSPSMWYYNFIATKIIKSFITIQ